MFSLDVDQDHAPLLIHHLVDGSGQGIQAAGKHHDLLRHSVHLLGVVELQVLLKLVILFQLNEVEPVLVVR